MKEKFKQGGVMMARRSSKFFKASHILAKIGSYLNDAETLATGNPKKIAKHFTRKTLRREGHKAINKFFK